MPIWLPPISRRGFLRRALAAGAAAALGQGCASSDRPKRAQTWALLSDIHIAADPRAIHNAVNMTDHLRAVGGEVLAWEERPEAVLINGDLAFQSGELSDYAAVGGLARPWRESGLPICLALGNHDHRGHFWETLRGDKAAPQGLEERQVEVIQGAEVNWFVMDSLIRTLQAPGSLGEAQRNWLARELDRHADKPAVVLTHHQPEPGTGQPEHALQDTGKLLEVLRPRRQVKAWFFGHTHRWGIYEEASGIHLINLPPVAYVFEEGRPNGWVRATAGPAGMRLELRCLDRGHRDHGQIVDLKWRAG